MMLKGIKKMSKKEAFLIYAKCSVCELNTLTFTHTHLEHKSIQFCTKCLQFIFDDMVNLINTPLIPTKAVIRHKEISVAFDTLYKAYADKRISEKEFIKQQAGLRRSRTCFNKKYNVNDNCRKYYY